MAIGQYFHVKTQAFSVAIGTKYSVMGGSNRGFRGLLMESTINGPPFSPTCRVFELTNV